MTRWNTDTILEKLRDGLDTKDIHIQKQEAGGDVDTDNIIVTMENHGDQLFICGFICEGYLDDNRSDVDVDMVEMSCGKDSRGGITGVFESDTIQAYADAMKVLKKIGFDVVPTMDGYF